MSALLRVMVINLAFLACSQGHSMPVPRGVADNKADAINYARCAPCPGETRAPGFGKNGNYGRPEQLAACPCPGDRIPGGRVPGFGQNWNYGSHGGSNGKQRMHKGNG